MKLDKRTKDVMMALVLGIIIGAIVYFVQRKFSREGYEGEETEETEDTEDTEDTEETEDAEEVDVDEKVKETADDLADAEAVVEALIAESQDVGEEEIDEFEEDLTLAQTIDDLELPGGDEMEDDLEDVEMEEELEDGESPEIDIAAMAQEAIVSEITKALKK
tara:strand:- start:763 stop:1251 length:489 start_codon:yes stop_codon:yes gene_type:complete